ncbi:hypothetical protein EVAR_67126_1 [Eumeta japonica]|uniref:Uncharacterized protein n=1 Tax=Eumeta variegata TaxID=151549 RepID=A0A4C1ZZ07_EUMVA|nr:hypothetical protein EVAR_67126_1 [Eumeta japonica]
MEFEQTRRSMREHRDDPRAQLPACGFRPLGARHYAFAVFVVSRGGDAPLRSGRRAAHRGFITADAGPDPTSPPAPPPALPSYPAEVGEPSAWARTAVNGRATRAVGGAPPPAALLVQQSS